MHRLLANWILIARASMRLDPRAFVKVNVPHILSWEEVIPMPNSLLVGIDVSSCDNKVRLLDSSGYSL